MKRLLSAFAFVLSWLPVPARVPAMAGVIVFAVAVGTTNLALVLEGREGDRQTERLARVYLDGLAASVTEPARRSDWTEVERRLRAAFGEQEGVSELLLIVSESSGRPLATATTATAALTPPAMHLMSTQAQYSLSSNGQIAWVSRMLATLESVRVTAALDLAPVQAARRTVLWTVIVVDLALAALAAIIASWVMRRVNRPTTMLVTLMEDAARGLRRRVPASLMEARDPGVAKLFAAYNGMIDGLVERERLRAEIAERGQTAALGRLAATMAHEVRNPLAGLATAVATLRKFGDDPPARTEALDFLSRGIDQIDSITTSMLNFHRPEEERRLTRADFEDMKMLVAPVARKKALHLDWSLELPDSFSVAATGVRQVLLNLLLNACAASAKGSVVSLSAHTQGETLVFAVGDSGPGLASERVDQLTGGVSPSSERLGLDTVVSLLGSLEAVASVESRPGGGTRIRIQIPLDQP